MEGDPALCGSYFSTKFDPEEARAYIAAVELQLEGISPEEQWEYLLETATQLEDRAGLMDASELPDDRPEPPSDPSRSRA